MPEEDRPEKPKVEPGFSWLWRAWVRLSRDRPRFGGGFSAPVPGYIPWLSVMQWAEKNGLDDDDANLLDDVMNALSDFDLRWFVEHQKTEGAKK
jgi:hypothetical protein